MARNGVHSGGRKKARYYKVWDKENGKYKGIWRIGARQNCIHALFYYERLDPKMEEYYEHLRQKTQIQRAIAKQNMERHDNYLK